MKIHSIFRFGVSTLLGLAFFVGATALAVAQEGHARDHGEPTYHGSIKVDAQYSGRSEMAYLASKARLTLVQALGSVERAYPSAKALGARLENANGSLVYAIEVLDPTRGGFQVVVDAGNGTILGEQSGQYESEALHGEGNWSEGGEHSEE